MFYEVVVGHTVKTVAGDDGNYFCRLDYIAGA
jgi:hypothetical protein